MRIVSLAAILLCLAATFAPASAYIGEGVQGRPHGGNTAVRNYYYRHGLKVPKRYRHHRSGYHTH